MRVQLVAVGTKMPSWVQEGYNEYYKRLPKELAPKLLELELGYRPKQGSVDAARKTEAAAILAAIPADHWVVALDVLGKPWTTPQLAENLTNWRMNGADVTFIVGGPDGLTDTCLARANAKWSLSNLTLPHPLVRIVFIEQLYRAWTILQNHPYHK